ncbi:DUF3592 domain-containing protein (plasmid) [Haladaptatus sp. SPP-AMP-3]|uniref:DUF3592 domain-containing protein n=1 Tax=Haladaptatus sp. SPP-AMP-3 TaxID=3121295 RepID=UPI003C2FD3A8
MSPDSKLSTALNTFDRTHFGALLLVVGIAVAGYGVYDYTQQSDAVADAVTVNATITDTGVERISRRRSSPDYKPTVTFDYRYRGESYTAHNIYPATITPSYDTKSKARSVIDGYETDVSVTAYVPPGSPSDGFLEPETTNEPLKFVLLAGGALILIGGKHVVDGLGWT